MEAKLEAGGELRVVTPSRTHFIVGSCLLALGLVALISWCAWGNPVAVTGIPDSYAVVFDAGSTGTRLYVYNWPGDKVNGTGIVNETAKCDDGDALSSFETHPNDAGVALEACINKTQLPPNKDTRAFLGATAGMRLVNKRNSSISDAIFEAVRKYLRGTTFNFRDNNARIINGYEEGVSGWISINYIMETLKESPKSLYNRFIRPYLLTESEEKTYGALDLGGASMQISFIPQDSERILHDSINRLRLYGVNYNVYSKSYLCYGTVEARRRYLAKIIEDAGFTEIVDNPCGHEGFNETVTQEDIWSEPCTSRPEHINISPNITFTLVGRGNAEECRQYALVLVPTNGPCTYNKSCGINGAFQPSPYGKFLAFSGFYYTTSYIGLGEEATMQEVDDTGTTFCERIWDDVKEITKISYVKTYCFNIHYIYAVLVHGYKFTNENWNIKFIRKANKMSLSWSLGFMLNTTNMIPAEAPNTTTPIESIAFIIISVIFSIFAIIGLSLIIYNVRKQG